MKKNKIEGKHASVEIYSGIVWKLDTANIIDCYYLSINVRGSEKTIDLLEDKMEKAFPFLENRLNNSLRRILLNVDYSKDMGYSCDFDDSREIFKGGYVLFFNKDEEKYLKETQELLKKYFKKVLR